MFTFSILPMAHSAHFYPHHNLFLTVHRKFCLFDAYSEASLCLASDVAASKPVGLLPVSSVTGITGRWPCVQWYVCSATPYLPSQLLQRRHTRSALLLAQAQLRGLSPSLCLRKLSPLALWLLSYRHRLSSPGQASLTYLLATAAPTQHASLSLYYRRTAALVPSFQCDLSLMLVYTDGMMSTIIGRDSELAVDHPEYLDGAMVGEGKHLVIIIPGLIPQLLTGVTNRSSDETVDQWTRLPAADCEMTKGQYSVPHL